MAPLTLVPAGAERAMNRLAATLAGVAAAVLLLLVLLTVADVSFRLFPGPADLWRA
jgi:hypothetical protein